MIQIIANLIINSYVFSILFPFLLFIFISKLRYGRQHRHRLPPGPVGVPILGYLPFVNEQTIHQDLIQMSQKYGSNIIYMKLGFDDVVILNDYESIKEILSREDAQNRPEHFIMRLFNEDESLSTLSGRVWKSQRSLTLRILRNLGFGKSKFEGKIHEECKYMMNKIDAHQTDANETLTDANETLTDAKKTRPIRILTLLGPAISNTISLMTTGLRYDYDHPIRRSIDKVFLSSDQTSVGFTFFSWASYFPYLMKILIMIPTKAGKETRLFFTYVVAYLNDLINDRLDKADAASDDESASDEPDNYIDVYIKRLKSADKSGDNDKSGEDLSVINMTGNVQAIFGAGSATTKDMMEWFLALMATHQDAQIDMYSEIVRVVGQNNLVSITDKINLPITDAIINETLRFASMVPINLPHVASVDIKTSSGHDIPKGTIIMANIYAAHMDVNYWKDPEVFRYERFLSADKSKCIKDDHMIAFGFGRRSCPGESMAYLEILIFAVTLIQKYHVSFGDMDMKITPSINGIARVAHPELKLRFEVRK